MTQAEKRPVALISGRDFRGPFPFGSLNGHYGDIERHLLLKFAGRDILLIDRNGSKNMLPHAIPYPNLMRDIVGLDLFGPDAQVSTDHKIEAIFSLELVKVIDRSKYAPGDLVLCDDFISLWGTASLFTSQTPAMTRDGRGHADMSEPFSHKLNKLLTGASSELGLNLHSNAIMALIPGPRSSTRAEVRAFAAMEVDPLAQSIPNEAALAVEAGIPYTAISICTEWAAGCSEKASGSFSLEQIKAEALAIIKRAIEML